MNTPAPEATQAPDTAWIRHMFDGASGRHHRQMEILTDLTAFVKAHRPRSRQPLPVLPWQIADTHRVSAEVRRPDAEFDPDRTLADPAAVVAAYAAVLGSEVKSFHYDQDSLRGSGTRYFTEGWFGVPSGSEKVPRTKMQVWAYVPDTDEDQEDGR